MVKWEGLTFFALLVLLTASLLFLYLKDLKKTKSLQAFFASMTHELKTPLASVKLQGEVISDAIERINFQALSTDQEYLKKLQDKVERLSLRLVEDANKLESTMDKILQLSRIEGGGNLHLAPIDIRDLFNQVFHQYGKGLEINVQWNHVQMILADEFALTLIFKNLIENTLIHAGEKKIWVESRENNEYIEFLYQDKGNFTGDISKLGSLFYKHNSKKGSGIGLYLMKNLMEKMRGKWEVFPGETMRFHLSFKKGGQNV